MPAVFDLPVSEHDLADLRRRLRETRWPTGATDPRQGVALETMRKLCGYWAEGYDWRRCTRRLTDIGLFRTVIDGLGITFLHARSPRAGAFPLILTHGWPGSIIEFVEAIEPLTEAGFTCVIPSLPGYGWSEQPSTSGWGVQRIARAWASLMAELHYPRYGAVGSDWGTSISASLAQQDPDHVAGVHLLPPLAPPVQDTAGSRTTSTDDSGYSTEQRTRPQTIGYALTDSPAGLAAWIVEKIESWTDPRSQLSPDTVIDNLMHYYLPRTGASAARLYWESHDDVTRWIDGPLEERDLVHAPAGGSVFPYELQQPSRLDAERRFTDLRYWSRPEIGGHFAAWEQPVVFAAEVASFFALVR